MTRAGVLLHVTETVAKDGKDSAALLRLAQAHRISHKTYTQAVHAGYRLHEQVLRAKWLAAK